MKIAIDKLIPQSLEVLQGVLSSRGRIEEMKYTLSTKQNRFFNLLDLLKPLKIKKENNLYRVYDDNHRLQALKELNQKFIFCIIE